LAAERQRERRRANHNRYAVLANDTSIEALD
jgi:hypothetical protein